MVYILFIGVKLFSEFDAPVSRLKMIANLISNSDYKTRDDVKKSMNYFVFLRGQYHFFASLQSLI